MDPSLLKKDASDSVDNLLTEYDWSTWTVTVQATAQYLAEAFGTGADDAAYALQADLFNATDPRALEYAEQRIGELIGTGQDPKFALDATTRQAIHDALVSALEAGPQSIEDLADLIQNGYSFSDWRCENIARTETGNAYNKGTLVRYQAGDVAKVEVFDGEEHDDACREANGSEWDLEYAMEHLLEHPSCLVPGTLVRADNLEASFTRRYEGEVIVLRTASNHELTVTPNHPILSTRGWVPAGELCKGDYVICDFSTDWAGSSSDHDTMPARIEEIAESLPVVLPVVPLTAEDFHGDGTDGDVCIIRTDSFLSDGIHSASNEGAVECPLSRADVSASTAGVSSQGFNSLSPFNKSLKSLLPATSRNVSGSGDSSSIFRSHSGVSQFKGLCLGTNNSQFLQSSSDSGGLDSIPVSNVIRGQAISDIELEQFIVRWERDVTAARCSENEPRFMKSSLDAVTTNSQTFGQGIGALSGEVAAVQLINVDRQFYSGHVYNLQTSQNWYVANSIITHNCVRAFAPIIDPEVISDA